MLEQFKYVKNVTPEQGTILLYNQIGSYVDDKGNYQEGVNGERFAYEMQWMASQCDVINVRINSIGGSVLDGYSIVSAILNSPKPVNTYIDGLAASTAGWIAVAGKKCSMMDYGTLMMHNPEGGDDKKVLGLIKDTIVTILSNRTNKTAEEIDALMNKETWMSAKEALENGMVDEVVSSDKGMKKIKIKKGESLSNIALIYNSIIQPKKNMTKINTLLKISNEASESEQEQAIVGLNKAISDKDSEIEDLKNRLKVLEDEKAANEIAAKEALKNKAIKLVENAIKEGKLTESEKDATVLNASKDAESFEFVSNFISRLTNGKESKKPFDLKNVTKPDGSTEDRSTWKFSDWSKRDEKGLAKMQKENPEQFINLYNEEFKK